jgi:hypothetical protein
VLIAIDPHSGGKEQANLHLSTRRILEKNISRFQVKRYIRIIEKTSDEALTVLENARPRLVFIDGDHDHKMVSDDVERWGRLLRHNGYLLLHDVMDIVGPQMVFKELLKSKNFIFVDLIGNLAVFRKTSGLNFLAVVKNWIVLLIYLLFYSFYHSHNDIYNYPELLNKK